MRYRHFKTYLKFHKPKTKNFVNNDIKKKKESGQFG